MIGTSLGSYIRGQSINNLRLGKIIAKEGTTHTVRIGSAQITCHYSGSASVGQHVTLECHDGDLTKSYILATAPIGIAEGGNVAI
ncbi:MAG: hypothetical protein JXA50_01895 [Deltaproteobacteria bacterium]|nr:hypothetical protein [Deltaproteobacteria bacterium]